MSDLISRKGIIQAHKAYCEKHPNALWYKWSLSIMQTAPSAEPKIVRCGECIHRDNKGRCGLLDNYRFGDEWFCADGERRKS